MVFAKVNSLRAVCCLMVLGFFALPALSEDFAAPLIPAKNADKAEEYFQKGHKELDNKQAAKAEACYRKAIELNAGEGRYHRQLAVLLLRLGRVPESEREVMIAKHLDPGDWRSLLVLGAIYHAEKRYDSETATYRRVLTMLPTDQKPLQDKLEAFLHNDEIAVRREEELKKRKKEIEDAPFKNAY